MQAGGHLACAVQRGPGFEVGPTVTVAAANRGIDLARGARVGLTADEAVVVHADPPASTAHVPRPGCTLSMGQQETA